MFLTQIVIILIVFVLLGAALAYLAVNTGFECSLGIFVSISSTGELGFYEHCMIDRRSSPGRVKLVGRQRCGVQG